MAVSISGSGAITGMVSADSSDLSTELDAKLDTPGAWTSYTPTIVQGVSVSASSMSAQYVRLGSIIIANIYCVVSSSGTAGSMVKVSLPVESYRTSRIVGAGTIYDLSASTQYLGGVFLQDSATAALIGDWSNTSRWGISPAIALASGDIIRLEMTYEAA